MQDPTLQITAPLPAPLSLRATRSLSHLLNIPSKTQQWKAPVHVWIQEMYQERQEKANRKKATKKETKDTLPSLT